MQSCDSRSKLTLTCLKVVNTGQIIDQLPTNEQTQSYLTSKSLIQTTLDLLRSFRWTFFLNFYLKLLASIADSVQCCTHEGCLLRPLRMNNLPSARLPSTHHFYSLFQRANVQSKLAGRLVFCRQV